MSKTIEDYMIPGPRGERGPQGAQGPAGAQGPQGVQGPMGPIGPQGPKGERGCRGPQGEQGPKGDAGFPGPKGEKGDCGERGLPGRDGIVAFESLDPHMLDLLRGPKGEQGPKGERGPAGMVGPTGERGPIGETGPAGETGPTGPIGPRGPRGDIGQRGPAGPKGEPGGVQLVDHVNDNATWSSKQVTEYVLHGQVDWQHKKIGWTRDTAGEEIDISNTANGHVKNFKILGRTMTNLSTMTQNYSKDFDGQYTDDKNKVLFFDSLLEGIDELRTGTYTASFYVNHNNQVGNAIAKIKITEKAISSQDTREREIVAEVKRSGLVKTKFDVDSQKVITRIEIVPYYPAVQQGDVFNVSYRANKFMLLRGDYLNRMTPEYFYKTRGVGNQTQSNPPLYNIIVESRGKNLLNLDKAQVHKNAYIKKETQSGRDPVYRYIEENVSNHMTYIIHCKPSTPYTFSANLTNEQKNSRRFRLGVLAFEEMPTNGETGHYCYYEAETFQNRVEVSFTSGLNSNYLVLYLANVAETGLNLTIDDIASKIQLEEGAHPTPYEPYITNVRMFKINQQLKDEEYLFWKPDRTEGGVLMKGQYYIHRKTGPNQFWDEPTENDEEQFPHTFDGKTYLYVKSKIPSVLEGDFPIKAHPDYYPRQEADRKIHDSIEAAKTGYYSKNEWGFQDKPFQEDLNFIKFPNGVVMQWQTVSLSGEGVHKTIELRAMVEVYNVQVTTYNDQGGQNAFMTSVRANRDGGVGAGFPAVDVWCKGADNSIISGPLKVMVLAIGHTGKEA